MHFIFLKILNFLSYFDIIRLVLERNSVLACYFTQAKLEVAQDGQEQFCTMLELFCSKASTDIYMKSLPGMDLEIPV